MKVLVAIASCHKNKQRRDWQRQTWLPELKFEHKFFLGKPEKMEALSEDNVVILNCKDDYKSLPEKVLEVIRWTRSNGYDKLLKLDCDVYCRPERLQPPEGDYVGHAYGHRHYCSGAAYWLSAAAMDAILEKWYRRTNAEDYCVGYSLERARIKLTEDNRYRIGWKSLPKDIGENEFPHPDNNTITFHMYFPQFMLQMHNDWDKKKQLVDLKNFYGLKDKNL